MLKRRTASAGFFSQSGIKETNVVLCIQDTTIINYSHRKKEVEGLGKLRLAHEQGLLLNPTIAFTGDGVCLGVLDYKTWVRQELQGKKVRQVVKSVEKKESIRWIESYRKTDEIAKNIMINFLLI